MVQQVDPTGATSAQPQQPLPGQPPQPKTVQPAATIEDWKATTKWKPRLTGTASGGIPVEDVATGNTVGLAKPKDVWQERTAYLLAQHAGVSVAEVRLGKVQSSQQVQAISIAFGSVSMDVASLQAQLGPSYNQNAVDAALRAASGLLAFHAWLGTGDLKDEHLVADLRSDGTVAVAAIDFASSCAWQPTDPVAAPGAPAVLISHVDKDAVEAVVNKIEATTDQEIAEAIDSIPDDVMAKTDKDRVKKGLCARRPLVRDCMKKQGWIP
jgi:hypothetical protein